MQNPMIDAVEAVSYTLGCCTDALAMALRAGPQEAGIMTVYYDACALDADVATLVEHMLARRNPAPGEPEELSRRAAVIASRIYERADAPGSPSACSALTFFGDGYAAAAKALHALGAPDLAPEVAPGGNVVAFPRRAGGMTPRTPAA